MLSAYGSPYSCEFKGLKLAEEGDDGKVVVVHCRCVATRDYSQARQTPTHDADLDERAMEHLLAQAKAKRMRVVKSHFATGRCSVCSEPIRVGEHIARASRADDEGKKGGWSHVSCVVARENGKRHGKDGARKRARTNASKVT